ncbi:MAG: hypothetical protein HY052_02020 [Proteobacteria bacterium]|nr:hypothetical protein [Pseudomonadota bacterium]
MLSYRTFFTHYAGATPEELIQAIYADAKAGTGVSFEEWWAYQDDVWSSKYNKTIPVFNAPDAARKLLDILVDVGALEPGEK